MQMSKKQGVELYVPFDTKMGEASTYAIRWQKPTLYRLSFFKKKEGRKQNGRELNQPRNGRERVGNKRQKGSKSTVFRMHKIPIK